MQKSGNFFMESRDDMTARMLLHTRLFGIAIVIKPGLDQRRSHLYIFQVLADV